ncbi:hypothetical protein D9758_007833 [Tetrapyrgos nigripes]|uniref:Transcription factor BYE1 n=1 Tax=Tetrapyrgos nigripes TaxID=182062 RepID=A0A8H5CYE8_9AGAR|nr:hypothetical protein D9758_007833 [Tetrapyrgos nigripes]
MSSRTTRASKAAAAAAALSNPAPASSQDANGAPFETDDQASEKENRSVKGAKANGKGAGSSGSATKAKSKKGATKAPDVFCTCRRNDDGTPMVYCGECQDWYHFSCVNLSEREAEDINVYVCPACSERTGLHSVIAYHESIYETLLYMVGARLSLDRPYYLTWEGPGAVQEVVDSAQTTAPSKPSKKPKTKKTAEPPHPTPTEIKEEPPSPGPDPEPDVPSDSDPNSEDDDYVAEEIKSSTRGKRRVRRASYVSESDSDDASDRPGKHRLKARSPANKRKASHIDDAPPLKKSKGSKGSNPLDDPTRKYCLGKLEEVFRDIYLKYPHVRSEADTLAEKKPEELSEEERNAVLEAAKKFADDLELCVFEIHSEPDKSGEQHAGPKYKDRFRTLQFNLSKPDRIVIHKRIASAQITPKEISVMSSTDLANEELKQSIKIAEQEALEHSILQKTTAPRAKITHKGFEDIEDVTGQSRNSERERQEEEDRIERERMARLRAAQPRQRTASVSIPPESPVVPQSPWGAPPSFPSVDDYSSPLVQRPPLFLNTSSEMVLPEPELNLADLINIDDENSPGDVPPVSPPPPPALSPISTQALTEMPRPESVLEPPTASASEAESSPPPFSALETPKVPTFDLNSLWTQPKPVTVDPEAVTSDVPPPQPSGKGPDDVVMETLEEANDKDFDMFLEEKETSSPETLQAAFHALPQVWSGKIKMPLDSTIHQETPVIARQMGGKSLEATSLLWRTLFPADHMRIDGRVPVENSAKFLLQMRMNPTKELIAVAFLPATSNDDTSFKVLSEFLIAKNRHGLVFPWGQRPKDYHPGREFYIIPLLSSDPLPDYMELLDDLRLPKVRLSNYLIGIWILNKGKLASPPPPPIPAISPPSITPGPSGTPTIALPGLPAPLANLAATLPVDQNALAQEIASLTPEQMSLISRALAAVPGATIPSPVPTGPSPPPIPPLMPAPGPGMQIPMQQPLPNWGSRPGPNVYHDYPYPLHHERDGSRHGPPHDRGDRGRRGRGRGRGRERGSDDISSKPPVDSGWPRKHSGGGGSPPSLRRWGS